jgi:hypothetical protein
MSSVVSSRPTAQSPLFAKKYKNVCQVFMANTKLFIVRVERISALLSKKSLLLVELRAARIAGQ